MNMNYAPRSNVVVSVTHHHCETKYQYHMWSRTLQGKDHEIWRELTLKYTHLVRAFVKVCLGNSRRAFPKGHLIFSRGRKLHIAPLLDFWFWLNSCGIWHWLLLVYITAFLFLFSLGYMYTLPCTCLSSAHINPFLANSTFRAASPSLKPPFDMQIALPSPNSNFSSYLGCAHGQWCGKWTHARVSGQR